MRLLLPPERRCNPGLAISAAPRDAHKVDSLSMFYTSQGDGKEGVRAFLEKRDAAFKGE